MQQILVLAAFLLYHTYAGVIRRCWTRLRKRPLQDKRHHLAALIAALDQFQKAQVFFTISVQIASFVAIAHENLFQATSLQQLNNNVSAVNLLAFGGFLPVVLTQCILRGAGKSTPFTIIMTSLCACMTYATWRQYHNATSRFEVLTNPGPVLDACGGAAPTSFCLWSQDEFAYQDTLSYVPWYCNFFQVWFILDGLKDSKRLRKLVYRPRVKTYVQALVRRLGGQERVMKLFSRYGTAIQLCLELALPAMSYVLRIEPGEILRTRSWTLGQIVAVTVWVPVLADYIYYCFGKLL